MTLAIWCLLLGWCTKSIGIRICFRCRPACRAVMAGHLCFAAMDGLGVWCGAMKTRFALLDKTIARYLDGIPCRHLFLLFRSIARCGWRVHWSHMGRWRMANWVWRLHHEATRWWWSMYSPIVLQLRAGFSQAMWCFHIGDVRLVVRCI